MGIKTQEEKRAKWRKEYRRKYPHGFKRRRTHKQTTLQLTAQHHYDTQPHVISAKRWQLKVRQYMQGSMAHAEELHDLIGLGASALRDYLAATMTGAQTNHWNMTYHTSPRRFNLDSLEDRRVCFHYKNMYAKPVTFSHLHASQFPSPPAQLQAAPTRAVFVAQV
jgi:hypothetical protein